MEIAFIVLKGRHGENSGKFWYIANRTLGRNQGGRSLGRSRAEGRKVKHAWQFNDGGSDWCVHCGTFREYTALGEDCPAKKKDAFNAKKTRGRKKIARLISGRTMK